MIAAADRPVQRPPDAKLLAVGHVGRRRHLARRTFVDCLRAGDLVIANDAATLPASLKGEHEPTGSAIEVRLAAWHSRVAEDVSHFSAIGSARATTTLTEHRRRTGSPRSGDRLMSGPLGHHHRLIGTRARVVVLRVRRKPSGQASPGTDGDSMRAHPMPLAMWDVWTTIAARPAAFEPPSAGFVLSWQTLRSCGPRHSVRRSPTRGRHRRWRPGVGQATALEEP